MAEEGSKDIKRGRSLGRSADTLQRNFAQMEERKKKLQRRDEKKKALRKVEDEDELKNGRMLADTSQSEAEAAVEGLINSAMEAAKFGMGAPEANSQEFHKAVRDRITFFLESQSEGCKLVDLGPVVNDVLFILEGFDQCKPRSTAGKKALFPLPAPEFSGATGPGLDFLRALLRGLNSMHGVSGFAKITDTSRRVVKRMKEVVEGSEILAEKLPNISFNQFFRSKGVDYHGEEVHVAKRVVWESILPSLPDQVGTLDIRDFCEAGVLYYVTHFEEFLLPEEDQTVGKTPSVMVDNQEEWEKVAIGLVEKGLCQVLPIQEVHSVKNKPVLNGMFSVSKQEFQGNIEICRLIMNLKPANLNCRPLEGDTGTLPAVSQMGGVYLADDEVLAASSEDIRCFFYLFKVPPSWVRFLSFSREAPECLIPPGKEGHSSLSISNCSSHGVRKLCWNSAAYT